VQRAVALANLRLRDEPEDARALLARGAAWGVSSRYHMFRRHKSEAARDGARMRQDLLAVRRLEPQNKDALFGLGLYDYYADVLPRLFQLLRVFAHLPGGDRERGLALIEQAREGSVLHGTEVRSQLYEIYAWHERRPDRALAEIRALHVRHPGWPFWGLKLAEHLRDRMGLYAESATVARELMESEERRKGRADGVAAAMARVSLGESLLLDLRLSDARQALLPVREGPAGAPELGQRARLLLGRALELEGDREGAEPHYRRAAAGPDRQLRKEAQTALARPRAVHEVRALQLLAEARRLRERGRVEAATEAYRDAWQLWPRCQEAALRVAEDDIRQGRRDRAAELVDELTREDEPAPPWVRPWSWLLRGQLLDLSGERSAALAQYRRVLAEPHGQDELRERAAEGLRQPFVARPSRADR
jgi:hypothetical protein